MKEHIAITKPAQGVQIDVKYVYESGKRQYLFFLFNSIYLQILSILKYLTKKKVKMPSHYTKKRKDTLDLRYYLYRQTMDQNSKLPHTQTFTILKP